MANTNALGKLFICSTPQNADLNAAGFLALTWIEVKGVGNHGQAGSKTNILSYPTWGDTVVQKSKGMTDAGSPDVELARIPTDAGQIAIRAAAAQNQNYAFKVQHNDPATVGGTGTIIYNRGLVTGPARPLGRNEDFDLEVFSLGFVQKEVIVDPT